MLIENELCNKTVWSVPWDFTHYILTSFLLSNYKRLKLVIANLVEVLLTCSIVAYVHLAKKNILDLNALKFEILLRPVSN